MTDDGLRDEVELLKEAFPGLNADAVYEALGDIHYMELFPEDMVEERTSWDELYDTMCSLRRGFSALYDVVRRIADEKAEEGE